MAIVINGDGSISGISVGGLPDGVVDSGTLATDSVDSAELIDGAIDSGHLASGVGGAWVPLQEVIADNTSTSIAFSAPAFTSTYTNYVIVFNQWNAATADTTPHYEFYGVSGSAWLSSTYKWAHLGWDAYGVERRGSNVSAASVGNMDSGNIEGGSPHGYNGTIYCWNPLTAVQPTFLVSSSFMPYTGYFKVSHGVLANGNTGAVSNIRFSMSSGNIETGEFRLYGIKDL